LDIRFLGIVVIVGNYGSGKTEVAINLATASRGAGRPVRVVDLDIVNPYFRTREARNLFQAQGIDLVLPPAPYLHADLPIVSPAVSGAIRGAGAELTILDVGGDDAGATVLASLADAFEGKPLHVLQVVNPHRPNTDSVDGCLSMRAEIEGAAKLQITGWVGNAHWMEHTTPETIADGYAFAAELSRVSGLPLAFITAPGSLMAHLAEYDFGCPVLPIQRQLVPPWQRAEIIAASDRPSSGGHPVDPKE
jgi:hypothetical protein